MIRFKNSIIVCVIIISLGLLFQHKSIQQFPSHTHAWAQSDRYALALGFVNNNLNFFRPETFVLNPQFPHNYKVPSKESITAVDFPLHDYIPAVFMKISGIYTPFIFRLYILLYSFVALFFIFKLSLFWTKNIFKSVFITIFAATSPVFVYYQGGFLPTIPSLANSIIGIYFYSIFINDQKNKYFNLSILFLTIAALSRTTFAIPLIAVFALEFLRIIKGKSSLKSKIIPLFASISVILFYYFYNNYLRQQYGSMFLNRLSPAKNMQDAIDILRYVKENWLKQYFSKYHYWIFFTLSISVVYFLFTKRSKVKELSGFFVLLPFIQLLGCILFTVLMLNQFRSHDYYFLDTYYIPFILLTIVLLSLIPLRNLKSWNFVYALVIFIVGAPLVVKALKSQSSRQDTGSWDRVSTTIRNFSGSECLLDSLKIPKTAKILVIDAYAPNIPFILMNRKGYAIMTTNKQNIENALKRDFQYVLIQNEFFLSDIYINFPEIITKLKVIANNGKISVCVLDHNYKNQTLLEFLGIANKTPIFKDVITYDTASNDSWQNINSTTVHSFSGNKSGVLTSDMEFGIAFKTKNLPALTKKNSLILFSAYFYHDSIKNCELVLSINESGKNSYYKSYNIKDLLKLKKKWEKIELLFQVPQIQNSDYEFGLYIWNIDKNQLYVDDFGLKVY